MNPAQNPDLKCLNLGCGNRAHPAWTNVDFYESARNVVVCNLLKGIPFPDNTFDVVYHSHVLEHFPRSSAPGFIRECFRVLRPGGVLRVVVPDLEQAVRVYLQKLEAAVAGSTEAADDHTWMVLELYDQAVRTTPGGEMLECLASKNLPNEAFILQRCGLEARKNIERCRQSRPDAADGEMPLWKRALAPLYRSLRYGSYRRDVARKCRDVVLKRILGADWPLLEIGRFRASGVVHQWMYDRFSLGQLLSSTGFSPVVQRSASESSISGWHDFHLDSEPDGSIYKPESLFMEGTKPSQIQ